MGNFEENVKAINSAKREKLQHNTMLVADVYEKLNHYLGDGIIFANGYHEKINVFMHKFVVRETIELDIAKARVANISKSYDILKHSKFKQNRESATKALEEGMKLLRNNSKVEIIKISPAVEADVASGLINTEPIFDYNNNSYGITRVNHDYSLLNICELIENLDDEEYKEFVSKHPTIVVYDYIIANVNNLLYTLK